MTESKQKVHKLKPIEDYYKMVEISANKIFGLARRKGGISVQQELKFDLTQSGMVALVEAYQNFNTSKNSSFSTYAYYRIRGAMFDYLRNEDCVPRAVRDKLKLIKKNEDQEYVSDTLTQVEIDNTMKHSVALFQFKTLETNDSVPMFDDMMDNRYHTTIQPQEEIITNETIKTLLETTKLTDKERYVIDEYYFKEKTYATIGKETSVSESRVSQLHTSALNRLHANATATTNKRIKSSIRAK